MDPNQPDAVDPVCGMRVARHVALHLKHRGITYWFCDPACADTFRNNPERWVSDGGGGAFVHDHAH